MSLSTPVIVTFKVSARAGCAMASASAAAIVHTPDRANLDIHTPRRAADRASKARMSGHGDVRLNRQGLPI
jgi:hypothetical protein